MSPDAQFWLNWVVQLLIGIFTLAAVLVALFGHWLRYKLLPPRLSITLLSQTGELTDAALSAPEVSSIATQTRWYHIRIQNERRWVEATEVQVLLLRVEEPDPAGQYNATWIGEVPLKWRHMRSLNPAATRTIGKPDDADLVALFKRGLTTTNPFLQLQPLLGVLPITRDGKCKFRVVLQARGTHADSNYLTVEIAWEGTWPEKGDDLRRILVVQEITAQPAARRTARVAI